MCVCVHTPAHVCTHINKMDGKMIVFLLQSINSSLLSVGGDDTQLKELQQQLEAKDIELAAILKELEEEKKLHREAMAVSKEQFKEMQVN